MNSKCEIIEVPVTPSQNSEVWEYLPTIILEFPERIIIETYSHPDILANITIEQTMDGNSLFVGGELTLNKHQNGEHIRTINYAFVIFQTENKPIILGERVSKSKNQVAFRPFIIKSVTAYIPSNSEIPVN